MEYLIIITVLNILFITDSCFKSRYSIVSIFHRAYRKEDLGNRQLVYDKLVELKIMF